MKATSVLLASHGTPGALAAEATAFDLLAPGGNIHHLLVVPDFWRGMMGDDWLNNAATQARFGKYVEDQIAREAGQELVRVEALAQTQGAAYSHHVVLGKPAECLLQAEAAGDFDLVVVGSPRPKGAPGLRSRLVPETVVRALRTPLLVVPHPDR